MFKTLPALLKWDLLLVLRSRSDWLITVIFFTIIVSLFPLGVDAQSLVLSTFRSERDMGCRIVIRPVVAGASFQRRL